MLLALEICLISPNVYRNSWLGTSIGTTQEFSRQSSDVQAVVKVTNEGIVGDSIVHPRNMLAKEL